MTYEGASYVNKTACIGIAPTNEAYWQISASKGTAGATGAQGPKGDTGATGAQGPKGDTGATGAQGPKGDTGATGAQGPKGDTGATGAQGPKGGTGAAGAAATITIGTVTTGAAGTNATVTNAGTTSAAKFNFVIPRGATGATGATGPKSDAGILATVEATLTAAGWTAYTGAGGSWQQTVDVTGLTTAQTFAATYAPGSKAAYQAANISALDTTVAGKVTFVAEEKPSTAVVVRVEPREAS